MTNNIFISFLSLAAFALIGELILWLKQIMCYIKLQTYKNHTIFLLKQKDAQNLLLSRLYTASSFYQPREARINELIDDIVRMLEWKVIAYWEFNQKEQALFYKYSRGLPKEFVKQIHGTYHDRVDIGGLASGRAIVTKQPVIIDNWTKNPLLKGIEHLYKYAKSCSVGAFPIVSNKNTYGTLHIYATECGQLRLNEVQFFTAVANSLAAIIENDNLEMKGGEQDGDDVSKSE